MTAEKRRFDLDTPNPGDTAAALGGGGTAPTPSPRAGRGRRTRREARSRTPPAEEGGGVAFGMRSSVLLLGGAVLTAWAWLGHLNPVAAVESQTPHWPWHLFRAGLEQGGEVVFAWDRPRAIAILGFLLVLYYLIASILRRTPARGAATLVVSGVALATFNPSLWHTGSVWLAWPIVAAIALALTAGTVALRDGELAGGGRRALAFGTTLFLGVVLFFPRPVPSADPSEAALILDFVGPFRDAGEGTLAWGFDRLGSVDGMFAGLLVAFLVLSVLALFGVARAWTGRLSRLAFVLLVVAPVLAIVVFGMAEGAGGPPPDLIAALSQPHWVLAFGLTITFVAGLVSWLGWGGRLSRGLARTGLMTAVFLMMATLFRYSYREADAEAVPWQAGLVLVAAYLGAGFGAFLLPTASGVLDAGRPTRSFGA